MHIMLNLKTLSTRIDATIVHIGAVIFEPVFGGKIHNDKPFSQFTLLQDGQGSIDTSTVAWWLQQPETKKLGESLEKRGVILAQALSDFIQWPTEAVDLKWDAIGGIWGNPSNIDIAILHSAYTRHGVQPPWDFRKTCCARTLFDITGGIPEIDRTGLEAHDAFDNAVAQAMQLQKAMI